MAVYYKKLIIDLWDYKITTVQTPKITAYVENDHCPGADAGFHEGGFGETPAEGGSP